MPLNDNKQKKQKTPETILKIKKVIKLVIIIGIILIIIWLSNKKDGTYTEWSIWSECSQPCGNDSKKKRTRKYIPAKWGGTEIPEKDRILEDIQICKGLDPCIDATLSDWSDWTECSSKYKEIKGTQSRERTYTPPGIGGKDIIESEKSNLKEIKDCIGSDSRSKDGFFSEWKDVDGICRKEKKNTSLIQPCANGFKQQKRIYYQPLSGGVDAKDKTILEQWVTCNGTESKKTKNGSCSDWVFSQCLNDGIAEFKRTYIKPEICGNNDKCKDVLVIKKIPDDKLYYCSTLKDISETECPTTPGRGRTKTITKTYLLPTKGKYGNKLEHDDWMKKFSTNELDSLYLLNINDTKTITKNSVIYNFTRIDDGKIPDKIMLNISYQDSCPDVLLSDDDIKKVWNNLCTKPLSDPINNNYVNDYYGNKFYKMDDIRANTIADAQEIIEIYKIDNLINQQNTNNDFTNFIKSINECYTSDKSKILNTTDLNYFKTNLNIKNTFRTDILYPGICYNNEYTITSPNGKFLLVCGGIRYNLALYHINNKNNPIWSVNIENGDSGNNNVCMYNDGDLVIYKNGSTTNYSNNGIWKSNTSGNDDNGNDFNNSYCQLLDNGFIVIKNKNGDINLSGKMEQIISDIAKGYFKLTNDYIHLKGGDEKYLKNKYKIYQYFRYSKDFTWKNGTVTCKINTDGHLIIYYNNTDWLWTSNSPNTYGSLIMQEDGNLVLYTGDFTSGRSNAIISSSTSNLGDGAYALLENGNYKSPYKGHIIIYDSQNNRKKSLSVYKMNNVDAYYNKLQSQQYPRLKGGDEYLLNDKSTIYPLLRYSEGFTFTSSTNDDGSYYTLIMQSDGNLVLYYNKPGQSRRAITSSGSFSNENKNAVLTYQDNNKLAIDNVYTNTVWSYQENKLAMNNSYTNGDLLDEVTSTSKYGWGYVTIQSDGNVVWYSEPDRKVFWSSGTAKKTTTQSGHAFF